MSDADKELEVDIAKALKCVHLNTKFSRLSVKEVGRGTEGRIYAICDATEKEDATCKKIVKIIIRGDTDNTIRELAVIKLVNDTGLTPKFYETFKCGGALFIVMERFDTNMQRRADEFHKQRLGDHSMLFSRDLWREDELRRMFEIAYQLSNKYGILHGDLKTDQYLYRASDGKIVITDFGFSGTVDARIPALRGWSWMGKCGSYQPLPPRFSAMYYYQQYFNMYQLWSSMAFQLRPVRVLLNDNKTIRYISSSIYPYKTGHLAIPSEMIDIFKEDEAEYGVIQNGDESCTGKELPVTLTIPTSIMQPYVN